MTEERTPPVDHNDLKSAWIVIDDFQRNFAVRNPNPQGNTFIGPDIRQVCAAGADVEAIHYRLHWLELMQGMSKMGALTADMNLPKALMHEPNDAVFQAFAVVRMHRLKQTEHKEFPVDLEELGRLLEGV